MFQYHFILGIGSLFNVYGKFKHSWNDSFIVSIMFNYRLVRKMNAWNSIIGYWMLIGWAIGYSCFYGQCLQFHFPLAHHWTCVNIFYVACVWEDDTYEATTSRLSGLWIDERKSFDKKCSFHKFKYRTVSSAFSNTKASEKSKEKLKGLYCCILQINFRWNTFLLLKEYHNLAGFCGVTIVSVGIFFGINS